MADLERHHLAGVLSARALLDAVALIDQQLLVGGCFGRIYSAPFLPLVGILATMGCQNNDFHGFH